MFFSRNKSSGGRGKLNKMGVFLCSGEEEGGDRGRNSSFKKKLIGERREREGGQCIVKGPENNGLVSCFHPLN